ncbi:hypothetical protein VOLCADRAFT_117481 [Volvox carteri f. nagariensis]|uniref:Uncharacterized protein n=1 Tax=Volvox carteri f. nagariensis TaxID=3068 RepID=D8TUP6_VOLCA|nr:uncharacterized protein VOLCADRAFT_117481 [Volvox carteri f. nagariensis]EFJ48860.1 hypothetical protein VOLCADRAFT_117481 [Volvox carteri f. nagariensis]|eukprot:XP_002950192.1 hypothetical protein VOLCADRAFT_117481 [Volvox carteri f. nagariensis]
MTTYTVNLTGAAGSQVEREVRRLAGLTSAFTRPSAAAAAASANDTANTAQGASFDTVEEMGAASPGSGAGAGGEVDAICSGGGGGSLAQPSPRPSFFGGSVRGGGGGGGTAAGRGPIRPAFGAAAASSTGSGDACRPSVNGDVASVRHSVELADVTSIPSSSNMNIPGLEGRQGTGRQGRRPSLPQAFLGADGAVAAATAAATSAPPHGSSGSLSLSSVIPSSSSQLLSGQLGLMRDRKASRHNMLLDGCSPPPTPPPPTTTTMTGGLTCPATPGGGGGGIGAATAGASASSPVIKLPTLPSATPGRAQSGSQIADPSTSPPPRRIHATIVSASTVTPAAIAVVALSPFTSAAPSATIGGGGGGGYPLALTDSRPGSSRLVLARGYTTNILTVPDRRSSVENIDLGAAVTVGSSGGGGGGRWFQQDADDMEAMLSGNDELLERLMVAGMSYGSGSGAPLVAGGVGGGAGSRVFSGCGAGDSGGSGGGEPAGGRLLPRLADVSSSSVGGPQDRATAQLQELWRVQASVEDQLNRERLAMAAGRGARKASVLEDVAGQHQPRWQVSYNVDAPVTHAKLGTVDASRRSELDRAHLTKLVKEQKAAAGGQQHPGPVVPAAAVSPVVARARRLSTVLVA